MTRRDVTFAAIMSAIALAVYIGVKVWLGGHWDWGNLRHLGSSCASLWVWHYLCEVIPNPHGR